MRNGSVAHRDGRLRKGERVLSINGKSMNAITHAESMAILKVMIFYLIENLNFMLNDFFVFRNLFWRLS